MKLTSRSEYALLALVFLARQEEGQYVAVQAIAAAQGIPQRFLEQILLALKRGGFVHSTKGQRGGYRLALAPGKITVAAVVRHFDGALAPTESVSRFFYSPTPIEREKKVVRLFRRIRDEIARTLEATTIDDLL
jgi:Rrf2 family cysteine metabolism transcriptional repressor